MAPTDKLGLKLIDDPFPKWDPMSPASRKLEEKIIKWNAQQRMEPFVRKWKTMQMKPIGKWTEEKINRAMKIIKPATPSQFNKVVDAVGTLNKYAPIHFDHEPKGKYIPLICSMKVAKAWCRIGAEHVGKERGLSKAQVRVLARLFEKKIPEIFITE